MKDIDFQGNEISFYQCVGDNQKKDWAWSNGSEARIFGWQENDNPFYVYRSGRYRDYGKENKDLVEMWSRGWLWMDFQLRGK